MSERPASLAAALAAFQAHLPAVLKSETATVQTKTGGSYKYTFADLGKVSAIVLPLLGGLGLSFSAKPTMTAAGKFALVYRLLHESGEEDCGEYPLPQSGSAQELGSAITYARRYVLCSVTGVAPDDDDDGASATRTDVRERGEERPVVRPQPEPTESQVARHDELLRTLGTGTSEKALLIGWDMVKDAYKVGEITTMQANELKAEITRLRLLLPDSSDTPAEFEPESTDNHGPPAEEPSVGLTDSTRKRVFALFRAVGLTDDMDQHVFASSTLNRAVESFTTLTEDEGLKLAKALDGRKRAMGCTS